MKVPDPNEALAPDTFAGTRRSGGATGRDKKLEWLLGWIGRHPDCSNMHGGEPKLLYDEIARLRDENQRLREALAREKPSWAADMGGPSPF
jgi:hypothetical protein